MNSVCEKLKAGPTGNRLVPGTLEAAAELLRFPKDVPVDTLGLSWRSFGARCAMVAMVAMVAMPFCWEHLKFSPQFEEGIRI